MRIISSVFNNKQKIPDKYTCKGEGVSVPLEFLEIPPETKSLALIMEDPDAPSGTFTHWKVEGIDPTVENVAEGTVPRGGTLGRTSIGSTGYVPPCPPSGTHRYIFKLFALDEKLNIIDQAILIGLYGK